jgi:superoxide oxidase
MTESSELAEGPGIDAAAPERERFDQVSIALHWLTVLLIVVQFSSIWWRETLDHNSRPAAVLFDLHRNSGVLVWIVGVVRLIWRHRYAYLPPFPPDMPKWQQTLAKINEHSLYVLLLVQPITGLARVLLRGRLFDLFFWEVPALIENEPVRHIFVEAHELGAKLLLALIAIHVGAALFHRVVLRDGVLQRILPRMSRRTKLASTLAKNEAE